MVGGVCSETEETPFLGRQWLEAVKGQHLAIVCLAFLFRGASSSPDRLMPFVFHAEVCTLFLSLSHTHKHMLFPSSSFFFFPLFLIWHLLKLME